MATSSLLLLNWIIRGLNAPVKRAGVRDMVRTAKATVACLQETKLQVIDDSMVSATLGPKLKSNFSFLPADGTRGGVLIAASDDHLSCFLPADPNVLFLLEFKLSKMP
jgi:exonuclease III